MLKSLQILLLYLKGARLRDFQVGVSMNSPVDVTPDVTNYPVCATFPGTATDGQIIDLTCNTPVVGRYVILQFRSISEYLHLHELEVFGIGMNSHLSLVKNI